MEICSFGMKNASWVAVMSYLIWTVLGQEKQAAFIVKSLPL